MRTLGIWIAVVLVAVASSVLSAQDASSEYEKGLYKEQGERDLEGALGIYRGIVARHDADRAVAAKALLRMGICLEKLGRDGEAKEALDRLVGDFPGSLDLVTEARKALARLAAKERGPAPSEGNPPLDPPKRDLAAFLEKETVTLDFDNASFAEVVDKIRASKKIPLRLDPDVLEVFAKEDKRVSLRVAALKLREALNILVKFNNLGMAVGRKEIFLSWPGRVAEYLAVERIEAALEKPVRPDIRNAPMADALDFFRRTVPVNVVLDPSLTEQEKEIPCTLQCEGEVPLRKALDDLVLPLHGFSWVLLHGSVYVGKAEKLEAYKAHKWPEHGGEGGGRNRAVRLALLKSVSLDFEDTPLDPVTQFLRMVAGVNLVMDPAVNEKVPAEKRMVTLKVADLPLEMALKLILTPMGLTFRVEEGVLFIDVREMEKTGDRGEEKGGGSATPAERRLRAALESETISFDFKEASFEDVVDFIRVSKSINIVVDPGVLRTFDAEGRTVNLQLNELKLKESLAILLKFMNLEMDVLHDVLYIAARGDLDRYSSLRWDADGAAPVPDPRLEKKVDVDVAGKPLSVVLSYFEAATDVRLTLSPGARKAAEAETPHIKVEDKPLGKALQVFLRPFGLAYLPREEDIWIATKEEIRETGLMPWTGEADTRERRLGDILRAKSVSLDFKDTPIKSVGKFLSQVARVPIVFHPSVFEDRRTEELMVSLKIEELSLESALRLILMHANLRYRVDHGAVLVEDRRTPEPGLLLRGALAKAEGGAAGGKTDGDLAAVRKKLHEETMSIDLSGASLESGIGLVSNLKGLNIVADPVAVAEMPVWDRKLDVLLGDTPVSDVIAILAWAWDLRALWLHGVVFLAREENLTKYEGQEWFGDGGPEEVADLNPADREALQFLKTTRLSMDFMQASFMDVMSFFDEVTGKGLSKALVPAGGVDLERFEVTLKADDISLENALRLLLMQKNLQYRIRKGGAFVVSKR